MHNKNKKNYFLFLLSLLCTFFISNQKISADDITSPSSYYEWNQMDMSQPWNKRQGKGNGLCYVVSVAVQGARNGITKIDGHTWNPDGVDLYGPGKGNGYGYTSYSNCTTKDGKNVTFSAKKIYGNAAGDCRSNPKLTSPSPSKAIVNIEKMGLFPIIHISAGAGWTKNGGTHYMAVRQYDGHGTLSLYDPARTSTYNTIKDAGGQQNLLNVVAVVFGYGGGPTSFNKAPSKEPTDGGGGGSKPSGSDSSKSSDKDSGSSHKKNVPKIKPIFNPFITPKEDNSNIGYDTTTKDSAVDRGSKLTFIDNYGPKIVLWIQYAAMILMYFFIAYAVFSYLMFWVDNFVCGGWIAETLSRKLDQDSIWYKIIFPGSGQALFGFDPGHSWAVNGVKHDIIMMATCVLICGLVATNSLAYILGHVFFMLSKIKF